MALDNGAKTLVAGTRTPQVGDVLIWSDTLNGWVPSTVDAMVAAVTATGADAITSEATVIGIYTLPVADGNDGDVLKTNGAGVLAWVANP